MRAGLAASGPRAAFELFSASKRYGFVAPAHGRAPEMYQNTTSHGVGRVSPGEPRHRVFGAASGT